jgi:hypothetical protein
MVAWQFTAASWVYLSRRDNRTQPGVLTHKRKDKTGNSHKKAQKGREALKHVFPATGGALHSARPAQAQFGACNYVQIIRLERRDALVCSRFPCMSPFQMHYSFRNRKR